MAEAAAITPAAMSAPKRLAELATSARSVAVRLGNDTLAGYVGFQLGNAAAQAGEFDLALSEYRSALDHTDRAGCRGLTMFVATMMAVRAQDADWPDPVGIFRDTLQRLHTARFWPRVWMVIGAVAAWWTANDRTVDAAVLIGFLDEQDPDPMLLLTDQRAQARAAAAGLPQAAARLAHGAAMTREEIVAWCLERLDAD